MLDLLFKSLKSNAISAVDIKKRLDEGTPMHLIDVRTPQEFRTVRIPQSISVPLDKISTTIQKVVKDKDAEIIVYCQSGMRAKSAASQLKSMGYKQVKNLGGIMSWPYETIKG
ncbi:MAG: rhodanese-like domain-containing protein [Hyphomonadaceae bacterium]|nr:rhodanese-like domain-containing protein [Clostridia bacterium]